MNKWTGILGAVAPTLATMLGSPLAGAAVNALSKKLLGRDNGTLGEVTPLLQTASPDTLLKIKEVEKELKLGLAQTSAALRIGQMEVNKIEAANPNWFVSGWRPAAGWSCVAGLFYTFLLYPLLAWASTNIGLTTPPQIETGILVTMLGGLLGLGGMRGAEKYLGVARQ